MIVSLGTAGGQDLAAGAWLVVVIAAVVVQVVVFVAGVVSVLRSPRVTGSGRLLWILAMFVFPLVGPLAWFAVGRRAGTEVHRRSA